MPHLRGCGHSGARDADILLVQWAPISAQVLAALPRCRGIVRYGIGVDNVDLAAAKARGILVCNVPDYCVDEVADHTLALALALGRQIPSTHARTLRGEWSIVPPAPIRKVQDETFACAGPGRIARAVLSRAGAFGFRLAAFDPFVPGFRLRRMPGAAPRRGGTFRGRRRALSAFAVERNHPAFRRRPADGAHAGPRHSGQHLARGLVDTRALARRLEDGDLGVRGLGRLRSRALGVGPSAAPGPKRPADLAHGVE